MFKLGIVGGGAMGSALINGVINNGLVKANQLCLFEVDRLKGQALQTGLGIKLLNNLSSMAAECTEIILAVKPQQITDVLTELAPQVNENHLLISIAAGISLTTMEKFIPQVRLIRVMPNTPAKIGKGVSAYCLGCKVLATDGQKVEAIFGCVGQVILVTEDKLDAVTALSGSGPAYVYFFIDSLVNAGVLLGLTRKDALVLATETVLGAAELLKKSNEHPHQLMNEVTSPGGTTAAALFELEKAAFAGTIIRAVQAASQRSKEIDKSSG